MANQIKEVLLPDGGYVYIEMEETEIPEIVKNHSAPDAPKGSEQVSPVNDIIDTVQVLKNTLQGIVNTVHDGIKKNQPDEWTLELNIGFKGKVNPIPVLLSGESNAALKLSATWKKPENSEKFDKTTTS